MRILIIPNYLVFFNKERKFYSSHADKTNILRSIIDMIDLIFTSIISPSTYSSYWIPSFTIISTVMGHNLLAYSDSYKFFICDLEYPILKFKILFFYKKFYF